MTTDLNAARNAALKAARDIVAAAKAEDRDLTDEEQATIQGHVDEVHKVDGQLKGRALADSLKGLHRDEDTPDDSGGGTPSAAKTLGEHFVKSVGPEGLARVKAQAGYSAGAPEFKAATDPVLTTGAVYGPYLTEFDRTVVHAYRPAPAVASVMGSGTISGNGVTYMIEGAVEGAFATVAEGAAKPQIHFADPTQVTDALKKIAAWWDTSDEMIEDLDFMVSEINQRGLYLLSMTEDAQLLTGLGTGTTIKGLLNRSGIQTVTQAVAPDSAADALFRAMTNVMTATGFAADAILINPADYQSLRLNKDGNGQYFGGGYFQPPYGESPGVSSIYQPLWGLNTIVTPSVAPKTAVVGAFKASCTVYRKGGVRVESTNSDAGKFTSNLITTRIEERIALAVRVPAAIVKVTLL
jgi:HK97 family phage major capsid protein